MPYISVVTSAKLTDETTVKIKTALGKAISLIPGKDESSLMIAFSGADMFYGGAECDAAYVSVKIFGDTTKEAYGALNSEIARILSEQAGIPKKNIYVNFAGYPIWGAGGRLIG